MADKDEVTVKDLFESVKEMAKLIEMRGQGIKSCNFKFLKGEEGVDSAKIQISLEKEPLYSGAEVLGYISSKSSMHRFIKITDFTEGWPANKYEFPKKLATQLKESNWFSKLIGGVRLNYEKW
jgi:hypothetical protein